MVVIAAMQSWRPKAQRRMLGGACFRYLKCLIRWRDAFFRQGHDLAGRSNPAVGSGIASTAFGFRRLWRRWTWKIGDVGTVVDAYGDGEAFDVKFTTPDGKTATIVTVGVSNLLPVR